MARTLLPALVALAVFVPAAHAQRCSQVHQRDLAPARHVRLVERPDGNGGTELVGCILPRGPVRFIGDASNPDDLESSDYLLRQVAREKVLASTSNGDQYGAQGLTFVFDIRTGEDYVLVRECYEILTGYCPGQQGPAPNILAARVNQIGQSVIAIASDSAGTDVRIDGFSTHGGRTALDDGPGTEVDGKSLRLRGSTASWTHGGEPRSFTLAG